MTLASLFDGISGFPLAGSRHGIKALWSSEIEKFPVAVSALRFPDMAQEGDITKINGWEVAPVDIITFGSPCQDLSVAGKRAGLQHTDNGDELTTRSGLFMEAVRIIKEMQNATFGIFPRFAVWENVPGAYSSNNGEDFRVVLEELCKVADPTVSIPQSAKWQPAGCIMGAGYSLAWRTLDAQYWGVPQRRRRIYLVADFAGQSASEILFERKGLSGHPSQGRTQGEGTTGVIAFGIGESSKVAHCLRAGASRADKHESTTYCLQESSGCAGFNGWKSITGSIQYGDTCPTIEANMPPNVMCLNDQGGSVMDVSDNVTATLRAQMHGNIPAVIIPINDQATHENGHCNGAMVGKPGDPMYSLTAQDRHAVAVDCRNHRTTEVVGTIQAKPNGGQSLNYINPVMVEQETYQEVTGPLMANSHPGSYSGQDAYTDMFVANSMRVRRLTPLECERLQGYQDGWTDIPGASDSARYKALGNSLAIPCAEFVMEGLKWF